MNKGEPILEVQNISKVFPDGKTGLDGIDFSIGQGDFTVITGANGSGKTLLMSIIADLEKPSSGKIIKKAPVGLVFQEADSQILGETVLEDTLYGLRLSGKNKKEAAFLALEALKKTGLESKKEQSARLLSGGEKRRLAVSAILALNREIIILDEPYANLDWPGVKQVNKILLNLKDEGKTIIVLTHELEKILGLSNNLGVLFRGKLKYWGKTEEILLKKDFETFGIRNPLSPFPVKDITPEGKESGENIREQIREEVNKLLWL